jgi:hypothetical protein
MFTANDLRKKLAMVDTCHGIDEWLETRLIQRFNVTAARATIPSSEVEMRPWSKAAFMHAMQIRGFHIEYYCEDRPCGECWYKITLPPGDD